MKRTAVAFIAGALVFAFGGSAMAQNLDFQCFKAKDTAKAFVKTSVTVVDTYGGSTLTDFKKPFLLCDSATLPGGPANTNPAARLSCFKVKGAKLDPEVSTSVTDDFGTRSETIKKAFVVCDTATATP